MMALMASSMVKRRGSPSPGKEEQKPWEKEGCGNENRHLQLRVSRL
jgi:hypothetical protein